MTTFDVFCTLTVIDMREAERAEAALVEEAKKEADRIANLSSSPGDAAKGAKLFQVSSLLFHAQENERENLTALFSDPLRPVPHR
jgi:cytochrome c